jgi:hypothetical protein
VQIHKGYGSQARNLTLALDDLVLAAKLDFLSLKVLTYRLLEDALKDHLEAFCDSVFALELVGLPQSPPGPEYNAPCSSISASPLSTSGERT